MEHHFKFRAECLIDFVNLLGVDDSCILDYRIISQSFEGLRLGDIIVEVTLTEGKSLADLNKQMLLVVDSHVMRETLAAAADYTGKRQAPNTG